MLRVQFDQEEPMNLSTRTYIQSLIRKASTAADQGRWNEAWTLLEEGHIISQPSATQHTQVHWRMFLLAIQEGSIREIWGQFARLLVAGPGSLLGQYPLGNTGRSNVSMFQPMAIPQEIADRMAKLAREDQG
jgi:hypothetical protein